MARGTAWAAVAWESLMASGRSLRRQPGLSAGVVLILGLGVGANAVMFGVLDRVLFQPPAHVVDAEDVRRLVVLARFDGRLRAAWHFTRPDITDLEAHDGLEAYAAYHPTEMTLERGDGATRVRVVIASHGLFPLLGVTAARGRFYGADDDRPGAQPVAVVSHEFWTRAMGGEDVIGETLRLDGTLFTVVGVAPPGFTGAELAPVDVWLPLETGGTVGFGTDAWRDNRDWYSFQGVVRLKDGVSVAAAEAEARC